jgi:hypothetical protein
MSNAPASYTRASAATNSLRTVRTPKCGRACVRRGHDADAGHESRCFVPGRTWSTGTGWTWRSICWNARAPGCCASGNAGYRSFRLLEPQRLNPSADISRLGCRRVHFCPRVGCFEFGQSAQVVHVVVRDDHPGQLPQGNALSPGGLFEQRQKTAYPQSTRTHSGPSCSSTGYKRLPGRQT